MEEIIKKYSNEEITIVWRPKLCMHSTFCWKGEKGLLTVFNPKTKPWINPTGASTPEIIKHVNACPSGALSYFNNDGKKSETEISPENIIELIPNGPLIIYGDIIIKDESGNKIKRSKATALCRCGASASKPYCDGSHTAVGFKG
ncbi:MAG: (4Fe-4S)-binding protein [Bacteroidota bacterium]|nr:(4Fe-4S)-binding protein [Bacteroidota bacterium]